MEKKKPRWMQTLVESKCKCHKSDTHGKTQCEFVMHE